MVHGALQIVPETLGCFRLSCRRVISHTSVERYRDAKHPLPDIARELGVAAVVEGMVMRSGDRVRIAAQLIDARSDQHVWADSYERDFRDVLVLQDELSRKIASEIGGTLADSFSGRSLSYPCPKRTWNLGGFSVESMIALLKRCNRLLLIVENFEEAEQPCHS